MATYRSYQEYLKTPLFKAARSLEMARSSGLCRTCGANATEVHHRDIDLIKNGYPPWGCWETTENIEAICHGCHCKKHNKKN